MASRGGWRQRMEKAERFVEAAELLFQAHHYDSCVGRVYYAVYHGGIAVLMTKGFEPDASARWRHGAVERMLASSLGRDRVRAYRRLYAERLNADYTTRAASAEQADRAIRDGRLILDGFRAHLANQAP